MPHSSSIFIVGKHRISQHQSRPDPTRTFDLKMDHFDPGGYFQAFVYLHLPEIFPRHPQTSTPRFTIFRYPEGKGKHLVEQFVVFPLSRAVRQQIMKCLLLFMKFVSEKAINFRSLPLHRYISWPNPERQAGLTSFLAVAKSSSLFLIWPKIAISVMSAVACAWVRSTKK